MEYMKGCGLLKKQLSTEGFIHSVHGFGAVMLLFGRHPLAVCTVLCGQ